MREATERFIDVQAIAHDGDIAVAHRADHLLVDSAVLGREIDEQRSEALVLVKPIKGTGDLNEQPLGHGLVVLAQRHGHIAAGFKPVIGKPDGRFFVIPRVDEEGQIGFFLHQVVRNAGLPQQRGGMRVARDEPGGSQRGQPHKRLRIGVA